jgi:hypothetical protein
VTAALGTATSHARTLADDFVGFLETGIPGGHLFAPDVFCDFSLPTWRLQTEGMDAAVALRLNGHPGPSRVARSRFDPTPTGFVLEVEETWDSDGEQWYCRELFRADISDAGIAWLSVYCTGDWDTARMAQHAEAVRLIRP